MNRFQRLFLFSIAAATGTLVALPHGAAADAVETAPPAAVSPATLPLPAATLTFDNFLQWDAASLEALYRSAEAGSLPVGSFAGKASPEPGTRRGLRQSRHIGLLWKGKEFPGNNLMINRLALGVKAVKADVYYGQSDLDGRPSIILDYANTSRLFSKARDEMREVTPGLYLGLTYIRECPAPKRVAFYVVQPLAPCSCK